MDVRVTSATGTAERETALDMIDNVPGSRRITVGADKGYDTQDFERACRDMNHATCGTAGSGQYWISGLPGIRGIRLARRCASASKRSSVGSRLWEEATSFGTKG